MSSTHAVVPNSTQRLPRARLSSVTESTSPDSTSSDSHSSSDPDIQLSAWLQTPVNKAAFSMDVDTMSGLMDIDADMSFDGGLREMQVLNAFQGYNVNVDDKVALSGASTLISSNTKTDMLMMEEIIKDGAFEPASSTPVPPFPSYPIRSPEFSDSRLPPPPVLQQSHPEPQPDLPCIDPTSTQSGLQPAFPLATQSLSMVPTDLVFKTEPSGVLLLSPNMRTADDSAIKHESAVPSYSPLLPYDPSPSTLVSSLVVHPPKNECLNLPIFFPGIPASGTKSRVETQIKLVFELGFPASHSPASSCSSPKPMSHISSPQHSPLRSSMSTPPTVSPVPETLSSDSPKPQRPPYDKVGTYKFLRLPRGTATKCRSNSAVGMRRPCEVQREDTLDMTAEVVCCSSPHTLVDSCASCQNREAKRTARKLAARVRPPLTARSRLKAKGSPKKAKKAKAPDDAELADSEEEEHGEEPNVDGRILQFNCAEIVDFGGGAVVLPIRITCYCRHHKEKVGFNIIFTLRDHTGRVVGTGATPPILITDDHKSTNAMSKLPPMHPLRQAVNPVPPLATLVLSNPAEESKPSDAQRRTINEITSQAPAKRRVVDGVEKKHRSKPYDGRPACRVASVGAGMEGRHGVVLALHPSHAQAHVSENVSGSAQHPTPANVMSPGAGPAEAAGLSGTRSPSPSHPEISLPSPPQSLSGILMQRRDVPLANPDTEPAFSRPPSRRGTRRPSVPNTPPSPLSSPASSQADLRAWQPPLQSLSDSHSFTQDHQTFLDPSSFPLYPSLALPPILPALPKMQRLIPSSGPTTGGIEITVLGSNFHASLPLECVFGGAVASSTHRWSDNTLVCVLPPRATAGLVSVGFKGIKEVGQEEGACCLFNYVDESDRQLMELALQVVGLKMTGKIEEARNVAMRIVGNTNTPTSTMTAGELSQMNSLSGSPLVHHSFLGSLSGMDLEALVIKLLTLLDVPAEGKLGHSPLPPSRAIGHHNATGQTLLHLAVVLALPALVSCLTERAIDLDARNNNGLTALHFAALTGWKEAVELLLAAGADPGIVDRTGLTAAQTARNGRFEELEALFEVHDEHESVYQSERGVDGDDEAWHSDQDVSEDDGPSPEPSPSWSATPPQYMTLSRRASPFRTDSCSKEHSELEQTPVIQSGTTAQNPDRRASVDTKHVKQQQPPFALLRTAYDSLANSAWRAQLEKWSAPVTMLQHLNTRRTEPPPRYTSRSDEQPSQSKPQSANALGAEPGTVAHGDAATGDTPGISTSRPPVPKATWRIGYSAVRVPETEVDSYHYRPEKKAIQKKDRMLVLFWIPILFIGLAYALYTTFPVAIAGLSKAAKKIIPQLPQHEPIHV